MINLPLGFNTLRHSLKKRQGFFEDAIKHFDQALNIEPSNSQILYNKSICLLEIGNYKEGLNLYKWRQNRRKGHGCIIRNK